MLETTLAQLRFAASLVFGMRFSPRSLEQLVDSLRATQHEFGTIDSEGATLLGGPTLDEETRRAMQLRRFRTQAVRAARETAYYRRLFECLALDPARLRYEDIAHLPLTPKEDLRADPDAFVCHTARPYVRALTTGTTGWPTSILFSEYELRVYCALTALSALFSGDLEPEDIVQPGGSCRTSVHARTAVGKASRGGQEAPHQRALHLPFVSRGTDRVRAAPGISSGRFRPGAHFRRGRSGHGRPESTQPAALWLGPCA